MRMASAPPAVTPPHRRSSLRKPGGGFSFEVQHIVVEGFGWCFPSEAPSWCVVVADDAVCEECVVDLGEVGLARQEASHASDGILDAALLPGCMGIAEVGGDADLVEFVVSGELGAVVEGDGAARRRRQRFERGPERGGDGFGVL